MTVITMSRTKIDRSDVVPKFVSPSDPAALNERPNGPFVAHFCNSIGTFETCRDVRSSVALGG